MNIPSTKAVVVALELAGEYEMALEVSKIIAKLEELESEVDEVRQENAVLTDERDALLCIIDELQGIL